MPSLMLPPRTNVFAFDDGVGDAVGERIELRRHASGITIATRTPSGRAAIAARSLSAAAIARRADLARGEPAGSEVLSLHGAVHARDERVAARNADDGRVVADALRARAEAAQHGANGVELGAGAESGHSAGGRVDGWTGGRERLKSETSASTG